MGFHISGNMINLKEDSDKGVRFVLGLYEGAGTALLEQLVLYCVVDQFSGVI